MADRHIKTLYDNIEISDSELTQSRGNLLDRLARLADEEVGNSTAENAQPDQAHATTSRHDGRRAAWFLQPLFLGFAAAAIALFFVLLTTMTPVSLDDSGLEEIQRFVARNGDPGALFSRAEEMKSSESRVARLNALALISMLGTEDENKLATAQGLVEDPRPEFRAYYLEYLLDYADEEHYNIAYIEALMEKEEDEECLYLLGRLLKLALMKQADDDVFI